MCIRYGFITFKALRHVPPWTPVFTLTRGFLVSRNARPCSGIGLTQYQMEAQMRQLTLILAAAGCIGFAAPTFAIEKPLFAGSQIAAPDLSGKSTIELSAQTKEQEDAKKKVKKKSTTDRSSWGG
jgi:hypothetical protein